MKNILSCLAILSVILTEVAAQTYVPAAGSPLTNGQVGMAYAGQTISVTIPTTVNATGQQIIDGLPAQVAQIAAVSIDPNGVYPVTVTSVTLTVVGLPAGLTDDCGGCVVNAGASRDIIISGTPTEDGNFTVDITSETTGEITIQGNVIPFGGTFDPGLGLPPTPVPPLPGVMDAEGYTLTIATGQGNQCTPPTVLFAGLNTNYSVSDGPVTLVGAPSGGTFFGDGVTGDTFDPASAGLGSHAISYAVIENNCVGVYSLCTNVSLNVGNNDVDPRDDFNIYPNPSHGSVEIQASRITGIVRCDIFDTSGKLVASESFVSDGYMHRTMQFQELDAGVYFMKIQSPKGEYTEQLVVQ